MTETLYRITLMCAFAILVAFGGSIMGTTEKWQKESDRRVTLVDAYEGYKENGDPRYTGVFRDKELNTRFEWSIEPRTFRQFISTNQPQDMIINTNRAGVNDPTTPKVKQGFAMFLIFLGITGVFWNLIAAIFFRDPWRF